MRDEMRLTQNFSPNLIFIIQLYLILSTKHIFYKFYIYRQHPPVNCPALVGPWWQGVIKYRVRCEMAAIKINYYYHPDTCDHGGCFSYKNCNTVMEHYWWWRFYTNFQYLYKKATLQVQTQKLWLVSYWTG